MSAEAAVSCMLVRVQLAKSASQTVWFQDKQAVKAMVIQVSGVKPKYVDLNKKQETAIVRFANRTEAEFFINKVYGKKEGAVTEAMLKNVEQADLLTEEDAKAYEQKVNSEKAHFQKFRSSLKAKKMIKKKAKIVKPKKLKK